MAKPAPERLVIHASLNAVCARNPEWLTASAEMRSALIRRMERSCFELAIDSCIADGIDRLFTESKFRARYSLHCARVMANLDPTSSVGQTDILARLIRGEIDPYKIAYMSSCELFPEASRAEREEIELRQSQKIEEKVSHAYVCRKCGKRETKPIRYQGRAADEDTNCSIKCVHCGHIWRI